MFVSFVLKTVYLSVYKQLVTVDFVHLQADEVLTSGDLNQEGMKTLQQQEEMFRNLDVQYEMARSQTHTQRGMGLGFSTSFSSRGMDPV